MSLLLHVCCGPCLLFPSRILNHEDKHFTCYFYNPNIHPYREFVKRRDTFLDLVRQRNYPYIIDNIYGLKDFLRQVVFNEFHRCRTCYRLRLMRTVSTAKQKEFSEISTTLLYSRFQNHKEIFNQGVYLSSREGLSFFYRDFRDGWQEGIEESKMLSLYRQSYCGCIFSEQDRYEKKQTLDL